MDVLRMLKEEKNIADKHGLRVGMSSALEKHQVYTTTERRMEEYA